MLKIFMFAFFLLSLDTYANSIFNISFPKDFSKEETILFQGTIKSALDKLPSEIKNYKLNIKIKKLDSNFNTNICAKDTLNTYGISKGIAGVKTLYIHRDLVALATFKNEETFNCFHRTYLKTLEATIIHELIHYYDSNHAISEKETFRNLFGGGYMNPLKKKILINNSTHGTPDYYEYKNFKEALAVNFEYFSLDNNYQCAKPAYYSFLKKEFKIIPFTEKNCSEQSYILFSNTDFRKNLREKLLLDSKRIYQIHYLYAGAGKEIMSRWGHAMFRIITCAPSRQTIGPECLNDISHHVVISYRANISDVSVNYISGLFGSYPSQIFVYRLQDVIQEYTRSELRDLWSVPLNLNSEEKEQFVNLTVQRFWDYRGSYYFFSNNCATESKKHLMGVIENPVSHPGATTPRKIFNSITNPENHFLDSSLFNLAKREEMKKNGLLFVSEREEILKTLKSVDELGYPLFKTLKKVQNSSASERKVIYEDIINNDKKNVADFYGNLIKLEKFIYSAFTQQISDDLLKMGIDNESTKEKITEYIKANDSLFLDQWKIIKNSKGYGVPTIAEINEGLENIPTPLNTFDDVLFEIYQDFPEFKKMKENILISSEITQLLRLRLKELIVTK